MLILLHNFNLFQIIEIKMSDVAICSGILNHEVLPVVLYVNIVSKDYYHGKQIKIIIINHNHSIAKNPRMQHTNKEALKCQGIFLEKDF